MLETAIISFLVTVSVGLLLWAIFINRLRREAWLKTRLQVIDANSGSGLRKRGVDVPEDHSVEDALKELDARRKSTGSRVLRNKVRAIGLASDIRSYYLRIAAFTSVIVAMLAMVGTPPLVLGVVAVICAFFLPRFYLNVLFTRRTNKFTQEFPSALDMIGRGLKSGLPLQDGIRLAANEVEDPLKSELNHLMNDLGIGLSMEEAAHRLAERIPTQEVNFFAIVVSLQARTGGNLAKGIGNLAQLLRDREKLEDKVRTMSSEAKVSAIIIGAVPIVVAVITYFTSYEFISPLFTTPKGQLIVGVSSVWMLLGILIMRQMIKFDF